MKKLKDGSYINFDLILEIAVVPFFDEEIKKFIIMYWDVTGAEHQISGWYKTEKKAQEELDRIMKDDLPT